MTRRGMAPSMIPLVLGPMSPIAPPSALMHSTSGAAARLLANGAALASSHVLGLSKGVFPAMTLNRLSFVAAIAVLTTTTWTFLPDRAGAARPDPPAVPPPVPVTPAVADAEAGKIIARVLKTYAEAKTYEDDGESVEDFQGQQNFTVRKTFLTRFVRPKLFRFEYSVPQGPGTVEQRYVIWSEAAPERSKAWWNIRPQIGETDLATALGTATGVSSGTSYLIPSLLMPKVLEPRRSLGGLKELKLIGEDLVEGAACYRIEAKTFQGSPETVWIEKETSLVRKIVVENKIPGNLVTQTTTYRPKVDGEIAPDQFTFDPLKP